MPLPITLWLLILGLLLSQTALAKQVLPAHGVNQTHTTDHLMTDDDSRKELKQQLKKIQKRQKEILKVSDAYSAELGEFYFDYGQILTRLNRYDEAIEAYKQALHINKIEYGVYSSTQRIILDKLINAYIAKNNLTKGVKFVDRLLWVEDKNKASSDSFSFPILVKMGNAMIDDYLADPNSSEESLSHLYKARSYFNIAFYKAEDKLLSEQALPYGEIALIAVLEKQILNNSRNSFAQASINSRTSADTRFFTRKQQSLRGFEDQRELERVSNLLSTYPRAIKVMEQYLKRAIKENDAEHTVKAHLNLGDIHLLFQKRGMAERHYRQAWGYAQQLPKNNPIKQSFDVLVELPHFYSSQKRQSLVNKHKIPVDVFLSVKPSGRVNKVVVDPNQANYKLYKSSAKIQANRLFFRPKITKGQIQESGNIHHTVYVKKRVQKSNVKSDKSKKKDN